MSERLKGRNYAVFLDGSRSMVMFKDTPTGQTRWDYSKEWVASLAGYVETFDTDGIDVYVFGAQFRGGYKKWTGVTSATVMNVLSEVTPFGGTVFASALSDALKAHDPSRGTILLANTDGAFDDHPEVVKTLIGFTKTMDRDEECGVLFVQVGHDPDATAALKRLDDDLQRQGAKFDIVDVKHMDDLAGMTPEEIILGALDD